eukprot:UN03226
MAMPTVTYGAPVVTEAAAAPFFGTPVVYSAPQAVYAISGQVTYLSAPSAEAGQVVYASPAAAEMGQATFAAPLAGAEVGHMTYIASAGAETSQAAVGQALCVAGQQFWRMDKSCLMMPLGLPSRRVARSSRYVPTVVEGSPVPTYVAPYVYD